nr:facilitated trehalose transporter Tret1-2 homolog [Penaeus vannamei]
MLLAGRFLSGVFSGMMSVTGNVYAVELPDTNVRGFLAMIPNVMVSVGLLASVSLGLCLRWFEIPAVAIGVFAACCASVSFVPESPTFLAVSGRESEARRVLRRLRGPSADVEEEMEVLRAYNQDKTGQPIYKLLLQRDVLRALLVIQGLFLIQNFCGFSAFMINTTRIFQDAGSSLDEELSSILVFLVQMAGNVVASLLLDRAGRRAPLVVSLSVMAVCLYVMGSYVYFAERQDPGFGVGPSLCPHAEYFRRVSEPSSSRPCRPALTTPGLYWFYWGVSIVGVLFCTAFVRETMRVAVG